MMRSMFSGVSGLQVHQAKMDVIGNNIANVNTVGYKGSNVSFQEIFSQTIKGAGSPQGGRGGTNPQQIGLGVNVSAINVNHAKGSTQRTDNPDDIMIDGNGFFVVSNDENALNRFFTRAGNFSRDKLGYLVAPNGYKVLDKDMKPVQINMSDTKVATPTTKIAIKENLNVNSVPTATNLAAQTINVDLYDSLGATHTVEIKFGEVVKGNTAAATAVPPKNHSYRAIQVDTGDSAPIGTLAWQAAGTTPNVPANNEPLYAEFDATGTFKRLVKGITLDANKSVTAIGTAAGASEAINKVMTVPGANDITLPIDLTAFKDMTQFAKETNVSASSLDGNAAGSLDSYTIASNGEVIGTFTNGERKVLATIGLATFDNNVGLMKVGSNMFTGTPNSGTPKYGTPATGSFGSLTPGALEMSNVDLSKAFTEMITTQRGFQSNSRVITTTDEMLQELVSLKR